MLATVAIQSPWSHSGGETIVVMKSSEHGPGLDHGAERELRRPRKGVERGWGALVDALVRSRSVEVGPVLVKNAPEMNLAEEEHLVEALPP